MLRLPPAYRARGALFARAPAVAGAILCSRRLRFAPNGSWGAAPRVAAPAGQHTPSHAPGVGARGETELAARSRVLRNSALPVRSPSRTRLIRCTILPRSKSTFSRLQRSPSSTACCRCAGRSTRAHSGSRLACLRSLVLAAQSIYMQCIHVSVCACVSVSVCLWYMFMRQGPATHERDRQVAPIHDMKCTCTMTHMCWRARL